MASFLPYLAKDEKQLLRIALYFTGFCFLQIAIFLHFLISRPEAVSVHHTELCNRMEFEEGHAYPGNLGGHDPSVNKVVGIGPGMPTPL